MGEKQIKKIYEELEKGNFSVITSDCGAREVVRQNIMILLKKIMIKLHHLLALLI
ncbi:MAG: hypothetical protein V8Q71_04760 [Bacilli bacterium]